MKALGKAAAMALPLALLAGVVLGFRHHFVLGQPAARHRAAQTGITCPWRMPVPPYIGVSPGKPWQSRLAGFLAATHVRPQIVVSYVRFGSGFNAARTCQIARAGGMLMIQMNPRTASLADIAAGRYDAYLASYAKAVRDSGGPVVFSFAHEMNGHWYPWGYQHTSPRVFVAAWRHIHQRFALAGADNVIWCWNVNRATSPTSHVVVPPRPWWPGAGYVDWVGVDAYYNSPTDTFGSVFGGTLAEIRSFTGKPVIVAETAVAPGPRQAAQIHGLFAGLRAHKWMLGMVWFDIDRRERWRIDQRPAAITAFRGGAVALRRSPAGPG